MLHTLINRSDARREEDEKTSVAVLKSSELLEDPVYHTITIRKIFMTKVLQGHRAEDF